MSRLIIPIDPRGRPELELTTSDELEKLFKSLDAEEITLSDDDLPLRMRVWDRDS